VLVLAALIHACYELSWNPTVVVLATFSLLAIATLWRIHAYNLLIAGAAALEYITYTFELPAWSQLVVILAVLSLHSHMGVDENYIAGWAIMRTIIMTTTAPEGVEVAWRFAQVYLLIALAMYQLVGGRLRTIGIATALILVLLMYSASDAVPWNIPVLVIATPLAYFIAGVIPEDTKAHSIPAFLIAIMVAVCYAWPRPGCSGHGTIASNSTVCTCYDGWEGADCFESTRHDACHAILNAQACLDDGAKQVTAACCCIDGFMKVPGVAKCAPTWCSKYLLITKPGPEDCCKIARSTLTDHLLGGKYSCVCSQGYDGPDPVVRGIPNLADGTCTCAAGYGGRLCEVDNRPGAVAGASADQLTATTESNAYSY